MSVTSNSMQNMAHEGIKILMNFFGVTDIVTISALGASWRNK